LKIITTALFSVTMLQRKLSLHQWIALFLLTAGIAIVQIPSTDNAPEPPVQQGDGGLSPRSHNNELDEHMDRGIGLISVLIACTISGLAGVYFEKVLKGSSASLWVRNVQLSFYSLFPALFLGVILKDGREIMEKGFFYGYNGVVWTAIGFQAAGGIVVALCVNYADNIAKNFATSISILLSSIASVYLFDFQLTLWFVVGASVVLFATFLYSKPDGPKRDEPVYIPLGSTKIDDDRSTASASPSNSSTGARPTSPSEGDHKRNA